MAELGTEEGSARLTLSRAFLRQLPSVLPDLRAHMVFWSLFAGGVALDLWTKKAVFDWLKPHEILPVVNGFLQFVPALNNGAAFGWFAGKAWFLTSVSAVALAVILGIFLLSGSRSRLVHVALGLFAAGVCGNLYDRIFNNGSVRDFIDVYYRSYHWHTFNAADSLLCIGVGLLIISASFTEKPARKRDPQQK